MRIGLKYLSATIVLAVIIIGGFAGKILLDLNDHIDRCADETSGRYIWEKGKRKIACNQ